MIGSIAGVVKKTIYYNNLHGFTLINFAIYRKGKKYLPYKRGYA